MKTVFSTLLFLCLFYHVNCMGQVYVDGVAIDTVDTPFIQLIGSYGVAQNKAHILIDTGQSPIGITFGNQKIAGPDKQPIKFKSPIDALNFIIKQGWELVAFDSSSTNLFVYLLQRKKKAAEQSSI